MEDVIVSREPEQPSAVSPTTTEEQQKVSASQRKVNLVWEYSQSVIAFMVTIATLSVCVILVMRGDTTVALQLLSNAFFLIIGFYFGRTNHTRTGGVRNEAER
jgi:ABC-type bacteriocin/lantibiotic exporter with double-glycine peptidase domain